jgi:hypothetical protein
MNGPQQEQSMQVRHIPISSIMIALLIMALATDAAAQDAPTTEDTAQSTSAIELGANLRTDFGVHSLRLDAAYAAERFRVLLVVDPWVWTDSQSSTDLIGFFRTSKFEPYLGWRLNTVPAVDGSQLQHNLLLGTALRFPEFFDGRVSGEWGFELAMMLYKHGGGVPSNSISFESGRHYLDFVNFGMFARFHYDIPLGGI